MKNEDQHCTPIAIFRYKQLFCVDPQPEVPVQVRARRLREHEVVRGVVGRTLCLDPIIHDVWSPGVLSWTPGPPCNSHHARHKTHRHLLFLRCGSFLCHNSVGGRGSGQQRAFGCVFPLLLSPICRGDAANPLLESAFITHYGGVSLSSVESRHRLCFFFNRVSPLLVFSAFFKTRSGQDMFHDACFCLTPHHKTNRPPPTRVPSTMSLSSRTCCLLCSTCASD